MFTTYNTGKLLTPDDFEEVYDALHGARTKWRHIGRKLGIKRHNLNNIEDQYGTKGNDRCLEEMVATFLNSPDLSPTWKTVINALKHEVVGEGALADKIERKYGEPDIKEEDKEASKPHPRECRTEHEQK